MEKSTRGQKMAELLAEQSASGLNKQDFCKERGINPANFYYWQRRLREREQAGFQRIVPNQDYQLEVQLRSGDWIGLRSPSLKTLSSLIEAMSDSNSWFFLPATLFSVWSPYRYAQRVRRVEWLGSSTYRP